MVHTRGVIRFRGQLKTCELVFDPARRRWYARIVVEMPDPVRAPRLEKWAGVDTGARCLAAVAVEGDTLLRLYRAREVWRDFLYWTRRIASEQARLAKMGVRTSQTLRRFYRQRRLRTLHAFQALACQVARELRRAGVTHAALEDLTGIRAGMDFGPGNLLVHNFWAFRLWRRTLEAAMTRTGISVLPVEPRGTSSGCSECGGPIARPVRHKAICRHCAATFHADANAARNILRRAANIEAPSKGDGAKAEAPALCAFRWNRHRWVATGAKSAAARLFAASRVHRAA